jgi:hypothetical protein
MKRHIAHWRKTIGLEAQRFLLVLTLCIMAEVYHKHWSNTLNFDNQIIEEQLTTWKEEYQHLKELGTKLLYKNEQSVRFFMFQSPINY